MNASTALLAVEAGATLVNDVSGGWSTPRWPTVIAETGVQYIAMHWRGPSATMDANAVYDDVVRDVRAELSRAGRRAAAAPGSGRVRSSSTRASGSPRPCEQNWQILGHLTSCEILGYRVLVGASRKRFLGALLPEGAPDEDATRRRR